MAITTYAELQTAVSNWVRDDEVDSVVTDLITLAEATLNRIPGLRAMENRLTSTTTTTTYYVSLPARFRGVKTLRVDGELVEHIPSTMLDKSGEYSGTTRLYAIEGDEIRLIPGVGSGKEIELVCFQGFEPLSDTNTSNWWLENAPDLLLYTALAEAGAFLKDDADLVKWGRLHERIKNDLMATDDFSYQPPIPTMRSA